MIGLQHITRLVLACFGVASNAVHDNPVVKGLGRPWMHKQNLTLGAELDEVSRFELLLRLQAFACFLETRNRLEGILIPNSERAARSNSSDMLDNCFPAIQSGINDHASYFSAWKLVHRLTSGPRCALHRLFGLSPSPFLCFRVQSPL